MSINNMKKITVSEYAKEFNCSVQSVYQRIKRNSLKCVKENGVKYVILMSNTGSIRVEKDVKPKVKSEFKELVKLIKHLQKQIDTKDAEIKRLTKELSKAQLHSMATMKGYIDKLEIMQLSAPLSVQDDDIIEVKEPKKKKKKSKNKQKKSKK
jgi:hypothetical protein